MTGQVEKWGDGLAVRIPAEAAVALGLAEGTAVDVGVEAGKLVVRPPGKPKLTLAELVAKITPENRHGEVDWGPPMGNEVW